MARNHESGRITIYGLMHNAYPEPTYISTCQFKKIFSTQIHIFLLCWYQLIQPNGNLTLRISDIWYTSHVKPIHEKPAQDKYVYFCLLVPAHPTERISDLRIFRRKWYTCHVKPIPEKPAPHKYIYFCFVGTRSSDLKETDLSGF